MSKVLRRSVFTTVLKLRAYAKRLSEILKVLKKREKPTLMKTGIMKMYRICLKKVSTDFQKSITKGISAHYLVCLQNSVVSFFPYPTFYSRLLTHISACFTISRKLPDKSEILGSMYIAACGKLFCISTYASSFSHKKF